MLNVHGALRAHLPGHIGILQQSFSGTSYALWIRINQKPVHSILDSLANTAFGDAHDR